MGLDVIVEKRKVVKFDPEGHNANQRWVNANLDALREQYGGKYIIVAGQAVVGATPESSIVYSMASDYTNLHLIVTDVRFIPKN